MLLDAQTLQSSSELHPQVLEFATANPQPPLDWDDWQSIRAALKMVSEQQLQMFGPAEAAITEESREIPMRDGEKIRILIDRPTVPPANGSPLFVFFFGGGWISGDPESGVGFARAFVRAFGATVVAPAYRLAPEHKFPTSQYDAWDTIKWLDEHAAEIGADPAKGFVVGGISAGGTNTAVVVTHSLEEKFLSQEHNKDAPVLPTSALRSLSEHTNWDPKSPWRYPILSQAPLSAQPPAYFQVDGMDPLRDDALIYDEMLKEAGVQTKVDFYPGCPHAHFGFMPGIEVTTKALADAMIGVGWLLGHTISAEQGLGAMAPQAA